MFNVKDARFNFRDSNIVFQPTFDKITYSNKPNVCYGLVYKLQCQPKRGKITYDKRPNVCYGLVQKLQWQPKRSTLLLLIWLLVKLCLSIYAHEW